jgi:Tfp pilus assembly protein PilP
MRSLLTRLVLSAALLACAGVASAQAVAAKEAAKTSARATSARTAETNATQAQTTPVIPPATNAPSSGAPGATAAAPDATAPAPKVEGFAYRPEGRRDPFVSLLRRGTQSAQVPGIRLAGLKGLTASEVTLRGTLASQGGYVAILQGADSKTYIVRPGEHLADGTIRSITADAMVILQQINDPLSLEKQREVRKVLRQTEEARP